MFGYVAAVPALLNEQQAARYRGCYCGLCRALRRRRARMTLTYDMAFLVLLLSSLYEPAERHGTARCMVHPLRSQSWWQTEFTDYGADMNLALTYYNCMDDWRDERKLSRLFLAGLLRRRFRRTARRWPRQCEAMERCLSRLAAAETEGALPDAAANCFGALMSELFVVRDDLWAGILRRFGMALGRFIYMMDAVLDLDDDAVHGRYNPLAQVASDSALRTEPETMLTMLLGTCEAEFDKLPLVQDAALLRSILTQGVWQKFAHWKMRQEGTARGAGSI